MSRGFPHEECVISGCPNRRRIHWRHTPPDRTPLRPIDPDLTLVTTKWAAGYINDEVSRLCTRSTDALRKLIVRPARTQTGRVQTFSVRPTLRPMASLCDPLHSQRLSGKHLSPGGRAIVLASPTVQELEIGTS